MDLTTTVLFVLGFVLLVVGAEFLVRGASRLAKLAGISPLVVGLTVVAYGTSAPEAAVCIQATWAAESRPEISLGNVIGSNIANILLVLGFSAVIAPLFVSRTIVRTGVPMMIMVAVLMYAMAVTGSQISRIEGGFLLLGAIVYTVIAIRTSRRRTLSQREYLHEDDEEKPPHRGMLITVDLVMMVMGLFMLVMGANWLVAGATVVAELWNVSPLIIGLTIVAVGTSLPEIATSIVATLRNQRDIAVGNVVGSNIFNILLVMGLCALVSPGGIPVSGAALKLDIPIMIGVSLLAWPVMYTQYRIARLQGLMFLVFFVTYSGFRYMQETNHPWADGFQSLMLILVIPLTTITLVVNCVRFSFTSSTAPETAL